MTEQAALSAQLRTWTATSKLEVLCDAAGNARQHSRGGIAVLCQDSIRPS